MKKMCVLMFAFAVSAFAGEASLKNICRSMDAMHDFLEDGSYEEYTACMSKIADANSICSDQELAQVQAALFCDVGVILTVRSDTSKAENDEANNACWSFVKLDEKCDSYLGRLHF